MPDYALICTGCGTKLDAFHAMSEEHGDCPKCSQPLRVDWTRQPAPSAPAHDLHGTRMRPMDIAAKPYEVPKLRELYGAAGSCWKDDGSVEFKSRSEAKAFYGKDEALRKMFREQKGEGKLKDKPHAIRDKAGKVVPTLKKKPRKPAETKT